MNTLLTTAEFCYGYSDILINVDHIVSIEQLADPKEKNSCIIRTVDNQYYKVRENFETLVDMFHNEK